MSAGLPPGAALAAWSAWSAVTPVSSVRRGELVRVAIPPLGIAPDGAGDYPDLRVTDRDGHEIPYALDPQGPAVASRELPLIDTGFVPGSGSQAVLDLGRAAHLDDAVRLEIDDTALPTYFERIAVDASDDRATWREIRAGAIVYRVAQDGGAGNQMVQIPATASRWLRVRVLDPRQRVPLDGASVSGGVPAPALVPLRVSPVERIQGREQTYEFTAPVDVRPAAVVFAPPHGTFSRAVRIESSRNGTTWETSSCDTVQRFADGTSRLSFAVPETTGRFVRIVVENGDDAPLALGPSLLLRERTVVFDARAGERYWLVSRREDPDANAAPVYDLPNRLAHARWTATAVSAAATTGNPAFVPPAPARSNAWLLNGGLALAAVLLGALALGTIRAAAPQDTQFYGR